MKLILSEVSLHNFLSHESTNIVFNPRDRVLISGVSGSGKSACVDGILWALFGKGRVDNRSLIRKGCEKCEVEILLLSGAQSYRITRSCTKDGKTVLTVLRGDGENEVEIPVVGIKAIQSWIEKTLLKSSYDLFTNSVVSVQGTPNSFSSMSPTQRKDLLTELADMESMEKTFKDTKALLTKKTEELIKKETWLEVSEQMIQSRSPIAFGLAGIMQEQTVAQSKKVTLDLEIEDLRKKIEADAIARKSLAETEAKLNVLLERRSNIFNRLSVLMKEETELNALDITALEAGYKRAKELEKEIAEAEPLEKEVKELGVMRYLNPYPQVADYRQSIAETQKAIKEAEAKDISCPTISAPCPKLKTANDAQISSLKDKLAMFEKIQAENEKQIADYQVKDAEFAKKIAEADAKLKASNVQALRALAAELSSMEIGYKVTVEKLKRLPIVVEERNNLSKELTELAFMAGAEEEQKEIRSNWVDSVDHSKSLNEKEYELSKLSSELLELAQRYSLAKSALDEVTKYTIEVADTKTALVALRHEIECLQLVKEAFGANGVRAIVADILIPELERRTNSVLSKLGDFKLELDTMQETASGEGMKEGLFVTIVNPEGERMDFDSYSGGEKVKLSIAIFEGLAAVSNCDFRWYDEAIVALDTESIQSFGQTLLAIKDSVDQLVVISHVPEIQSLLERKVEVVKKNGISTI